jgi:UDP-N-acetyl-D-glucosamine/UDP-N-acetyl-D-galactosamine dehydrogenase
VPNLKDYEGVILAVAHDEFKNGFLNKLDDKTVVYDVKSVLPRKIITARL